MKIKTDRLEKLLRKPEGSLPSGLRARTLRRLRLKPAPRAWFTRPMVWGPALASVLALFLIFKPQAPKLSTPIEPEQVTSEARNEELAYARRHPGLPGPTTSMQVMQARAMMKIEDDANASLHQDLAAAVGVIPGPQADEAVHAPKSAEQLSAPGSGNEAALKGWDENAVRSEAGKDTRKPYRLTVKGNRVRPARGEKVRLELVSPEPGPVHIRLIDGQSRLLRDFADLNDPAGPIEIEWDGRLNDGQEAPSGAYTFVIQTPKKTEKVGVLVVR